MKLRLNKSQRASGVMSKKVVFSLGAQVDLTAQEAEYVKKYKMGSNIVYNKDRVNPEMHDYKSGKGIMRNLSALALNINLIEMIDAEESVKSACQGMKNLLEACAGFEGEEIIEY